MESSSEVMWDRLCLELKSAKERLDSAMAPVLASINSLIDVHLDFQNILRTLNFISFELLQQTENFSEEERFEALNRYFFKHLKFQVIPQSPINENSTTSSEMNDLIWPCLQNKKGSATTLRLIYCYLAHQLQLPISVIHTPQNNLLKWVRPKNTEIIDINLSGRLLSSKDMASIFSFDSNYEIINKSQFLEPMTFFEQIIHYCEHLLKCYDNDHCDRQKIILWSAILELQPNNIHYLGLRALMYAKRGDVSHAKFDLKRYFSFVQLHKAPLALKRAYFELCEDPHHQFIQKTQTTQITTKNLLH